MIHPRRLADRLLVVLFPCALGTTLATLAVRGIPPVRPLPEERMSYALPDPPSDLRSLGAYSGRFERWFEDNLVGRSHLLEARSRLLVNVFDASPTPNVYLGRDRWVFLSEARQLDVQRGVAPFASSELDAWAGAIRARANWCAARGMTYVFALAPDKTNVYPERHAHAIERLGPTRFDQLAERLADERAFLDLRPVLRREKERDRDGDHAYFPYGSHWTDRGATAGTNAILERLARDSRFTTLAPFRDDDLILEPEGIEGDSWAARLYLRGVLVQRERAIGAIRGAAPVVLEGQGDDSARNVSRLDDASLPRVLALHDSFGIPLYKFFSRRASHCVFLRGDAFRPEVIESEAPDVVLEILCERVLYFPPVENLPEQARSSESGFESAARVVRTLDPARDAPVLASRPDVSAVLEDGGVRIAWNRDSALARVPDEFAPRGTPVLARFDVDVELAGELLLFYLTPEQPTYTRSCMITRPLAPGRNRVYVDLDVPGLRGPLLFRASPRGAAFVLRGLETRTAR